MISVSMRLVFACSSLAWASCSSSPLIIPTEVGAVFEVDPKIRTGG